VLGIGEKGKNIMKKNININDDYYSEMSPEVDEAWEYSVPVPKDFMPSPEELAKATKKVHVSIRIDSDTIDFFKEVAAENGTGYQPMINDLLKEYVRQHRKAV
jgi:uncharacterized protein (DUF4415 family)